MKRMSRMEGEKPTLMIIPMIDIIFFLLVFFMMSMLSMVVQKSVPVNLPAAQTAKVDLQRKVPITVTADGSVFVDQKPMGLEQMVGYLKTEQVKGTELTILLRADTSAQYGKFVQVLDTLKQNKITKIAIATESK